MVLNMPPSIHCTMSALACQDSRQLGFAKVQLGIAMIKRFESPEDPGIGTLANWQTADSLCCGLAVGSALANFRRYAISDVDSDDVSERLSCLRMW